MGNHNVFKVNATSFSQCIIPPSNEALTSGHDIIPLMVPGKKWYICGVGQHCAQFGQKLVINVEGGAPAPAPMKNSAHGILNSGTVNGRRAGVCGQRRLQWLSKMVVRGCSRVRI
ncbi:hypothetical protein HYC85_025455 [Camellia sinensis]|uniref:Phytocyanin domain-containing protein n=1 Tax=Camellia sinensis TaxID=4442 RepID=A0A7J7GB27_CAMSI|nr:hypothetical protein HYC85_025455 [Camellia sinensis]